MVYLTLEKVESLQAKALKLSRKGADITLVVGEKEYHTLGEKPHQYTVELYPVEATGKLHYAGWSIIGAIDHTENGNIIRAHSEMPTIYQNSASNCEHCNVTRYRKTTIIIRNDETGAYKQIGKTCLAGYIGVDISDYERYLSFLSFIDSEAEEEREGGYPSASRMIEVIPYLQHVTESIRISGFVSRKMLEERGETGETTATKALRHYRPYGKIHDVLNEKDYRLGYFQELPETVDSSITDALAWLRESDDKSDFIHNLKVMTSSKWFHAKYAAYIASIPTCYKMHLGKIEAKQKKESDSIISNFYGKTGDKIKITASVKYITSYETQFGITRVYRFVDAQGNVFIWKTGTSLSDSDSATITGTIKEHTEYKGVKQTVLTRCKIV